MKNVRKFICFAVLAFAMVVSFVSCATGSKEVVGLEDSHFVQQFRTFGTYISVREGNIALQSDVYLTPGASIVLDTNEIWVLNLNGHSIYQNESQGAPAVDVVKGTLGIVNGSEDKDLCGIVCADGTAILIEKGASVQIDNGTVLGAPYAIEVSAGGYLKVLGGRLIGTALPICVHEGWAGNLAGGIFSAYDPAYDQAILGKSYACKRFPSSEAEFVKTHENAFLISQKTDYTGVSGLKLSTSGGLLARFRLYKTYQTDSVVLEEDVKPVFEWAMYPGQTQEVYFDSGSYVLKVAEGYDWNPETGFGEDGTYWCMEPYTFADGYVYAITTQPGKQSHIPDTLEGFLTGSF